MSDVRERCGEGARWDLIEKPVVTDKQLGRMVSTALVNAGLIYRGYAEDCSHTDKIGQKLAEQIGAAGLMIVRTEEGTA